MTRLETFELACLTAWKREMTASGRRRWTSADDCLRERTRCDGFHNAVPPLLRGEAAEFRAPIKRVAQEERKVSAPVSPP